MNHPTLFKTEVDEQGRLYLEGFAHEENMTILSDIKVQYCQQDDLDRDEFQELNLSLDSSGCGHYYVLETKRWCFDKPEDLIALIEDFNKRFTENERN